MKRYKQAFKICIFIYLSGPQRVRPKNHKSEMIHPATACLNILIHYKWKQNIKNFSHKYLKILIHIGKYNNGNTNILKANYIF